MAKEKDLIDFLKDANDIVKLLTGKSIPDLARRSAELFGEGVARKLVDEKAPEPDSPYAILGVRPDAATVVVKAAYRMLCKLHGDNKDKLQEIRAAYNEILSERGEG